MKTVHQHGKAEQRPTAVIWKRNYFNQPRLRK